MHNNFLSKFTFPGLAMATSPIILLFAMSLAALVWVIGCNKDEPTAAGEGAKASQEKFETTGEEFLISALDEIESIADVAERTGRTAKSALNLDRISSSLPSKSQKEVVFSTQSDTTYIYGEVTSDGYGAVVTERHAYPKGLLLITVRKSYGKPATKIVSETKRYITEQGFINDSTEQSNITELYGLSSDTLESP